MRFEKGTGAPYKTGKVLGFVAGFAIFSFILHYITSKFGLISMPFEYFIGILIALYIAAKLVKKLIKYEIHQRVF